ncbi:retrovirus-related Pol polyprotein from transposon opus [Trichonephila clavipes]|nr:retrovirus-related Pol polyprotein from transposon opus [Trichonephila clavipes]
MITEQLKRHVPGDVREQFVDNWVKLFVPGDLADKLDEYESVRANVRGAHSNGTRHLHRELPKNTRKTPPRNARSNIITAKGTELEFTKEVVTTKVSISVSFPINTRNGIDDLQLVDIKCGHTSIKAVFDTGAQIAVLREDLIGKGCGEGEGTIQIISAFGEKEIAALKLFNLFDLGNQRDFESTRDKAIELRKEMEELRKETENETRTTEAGYKEEHASFKAEVEA